MIDDIPYIIVDNRKILPIERSEQPGSASVGRHQREAHAFGVVDRVTISWAGREKARQQTAHAASDPSALGERPRQPPPARPLLTY
ncbi:MAG: hypothetical protein V2I40_08605 [Desulfobacteraceae bacterium]|jgi:hypothetical protein|nr:hypothetical protein [Desulfobacteraceae bacterium]